MRTNREIAVEFVNALAHGVGEAGRRYLAPGASWWAAWSGRIEDRLDAMDAMFAAHVDGPLTVTVHGVTAEGDRVAVEAETYARLNNGSIYNNRYHFLINFKDGKIAQVREYNDTRHAEEIWGFVKAGSAQA